jgi:DNA topoisomerase-1
LGEHPALGGKVEVLSGRYGPYIKFGKVNATIPKNMAPDAVTMEDAVRLIAARQEAGGGAKKKAAGKAKAAKPKMAAANGKAGTAGSAKAAKTSKAARKAT